MNDVKKILCLFLLFFCSSVFAKAIDPSQIPPVLQPWQAWVLYDNPEQACPFLYHQQEKRFCAWPTRLALNVDKDKIYFQQLWQVFAPSIIALPGDAHLWPMQVTVNGEPYPVFAKQQLPMMELPVGVYQIQGYLPFASLPDFIKIPEHTGLVQLLENNIKVENPRLEEGRLWLSQAQQEMSASDLQIRVFRKINQAVPMTVNTIIEIDASGPAREVQLGPVLLPESTPMRLVSPLPAQLDEQGLLRLQLRPGKWVIELIERFYTPIESLKRAEVGPPWPSEELWSFALSPQLGLLTISGAANIDPKQTLIPQTWRDLPAYSVRLGDTVLLSMRNEKFNLENQLQLSRHMWLNFSGDFWTVEDHVQGQMVKNWRLSLNPPFMLGRFTENNNDQLITLLENAQGEKIPGVEVRQGQVQVQAVSISENIWHFPVSGWSESFNAVNTTLSLPPGWQLLTAIGVEKLSGHLLAKWSYVDLFIVLLMGFAFVAVLGKKWGVLAFIMLLCTYQQNHWLILVWLNMILALVLVQTFNTSRFNLILARYRDCSYALIAVVIIGLSSLSIITTLYPQIKMQIPVHLEPQMAKAQLMEASPMLRAEKVTTDVFATPVDAKTQTGPAIPQWDWTQIQMDWPSLNATDKNVYLLLLSPIMLFLFALIQMLLLICVAWQLWLKRNTVLSWAPALKTHTSYLSFILLLGLGTLQLPAQANDIPSPELLEELKTRLLAPQDCNEACATLSLATLKINNDELALQIQVNAAAHVAIPIPGRSSDWQADQILINGLPAQGLFWQNNTLMVQLPAGAHTLTLQGKLNALDKLSLEFPLNPHWFIIDAPGWFAEGLDAQQLLGNTLHLLRTQGEQPAMVGIAPFVRVIRDLSLGLEGEVTTRVVRVAPMTGAISLNIPLLPHESVLTPEITVADNQAQIHLGPQQQEVVWKSTISQYNDLTLFAPQTDSWVEEWQVTIASVWHPVITGIAPLYQANQQNWQAHWQPWPLQSVHIQLQRPQAMPGETVTIDNVNVTTEAFAYGSQGRMQALLRATVAGQQKLILPQTITLDSVLINGIEHPFIAGGEIIIPFAPGNNSLELTWHDSKAMGLITRTPELNWQMPAYNINLGLTIPHDRWVLAVSGPGVGPVLLYGFALFAALMLAVILGKWAPNSLTTLQWMFLTVGLSLVVPLLGLWVIVALVLQGLYEKHKMQLSDKVNYCTKIALYLIILFAAGVFVYAIFKALSGVPNAYLMPSAMSTTLIADYVWMQDFATKTWPQAFVISLPLWVYRGLMLLWSLGVMVLLLRLFKIKN